MDILHLLFVLIILVVVVAIVYFVLTRYLFPLISRILPDPFDKIVIALIVIFCAIVLVLILLGLAGIGPGIKL
jgi:hypothetical protein